MTSITARIPLINWEKGFERHWNAGSPVTTHVFNALSFTFPQGERFFMKVAKEMYDQSSTQLSPTLEAEVKAFFIQEAAHTKQHQLYNQVLEKQGYKHVAFDYINRMEKMAHQYFSLKYRLALVCAYEHYTAVLGDFVLSNPEVLASANKKMALIWGWHSAEETEHKAVCFDLYQAIGGTWLTRILAYFMASLDFLFIFVWLYFSMLRKDGCLRPKPFIKMLPESARFFWGRKGVAWHIIFHGIRYLSPTFHPWDQNNKRQLADWLSNNKENLRELDV